MLFVVLVHTVIILEKPIYNTYITSNKEVQFHCFGELAHVLLTFNPVRHACWKVIARFRFQFQKINSWIWQIFLEPDGAIDCVHCIWPKCRLQPNRPRVNPRLILELLLFDWVIKLMIYISIAVARNHGQAHRTHSNVVNGSLVGVGPDLNLKFTLRLQFFSQI